MPRPKYFKSHMAQNEFLMGQYVDEFDMTFLGPFLGTVILTT
jgi:hypothetical protein